MKIVNAIGPWVLYFALLFTIISVILMGVKGGFKSKTPGIDQTIGISLKLAGIGWGVIILAIPIGSIIMIIQKIF